MELIKNKRILALVGIICSLLGTFLPYFTFSFFGYTYSESLWGYWQGKVILILTLANILFIFEDLIEKYIPQLFKSKVGRLIKKANSPKFSLVPTIIMTILVIYLFVDIGGSSSYLKYGLGFWSLWVGIACLIGHAILYRKTNVQSVQYDNLSNQQQTQFNNSPNVQSMGSNDQMNYQQSQGNNSNEQYSYSNISKKYCPKCGNQVDENTTICFMCGNKF